MSSPGPSQMVHDGSSSDNLQRMGDAGDQKPAGGSAAVAQEQNSTGRARRDSGSRLLGNGATDKQSTGEGSVSSAHGIGLSISSPSSGEKLSSAVGNGTGNSSSNSSNTSPPTMPPVLGIQGYPSTPKLTAMGGIALANVAKSFTIGTPPLSPAQPPNDPSRIPRNYSQPDALQLTPSVHANGGSNSPRADHGATSAAVSTVGIIGPHSSPVPAAAGGAGAAGGSGSHSGPGIPLSPSVAARRAEFSGSGSHVAPLGIVRRVDTDDELLQQQVILVHILLKGLTQTG